MRKTHYKITVLEIKILHMIAEVKSSNSSLALRLERDDPNNIGKITKKLKDRNLITVKKGYNNEKKSGRSNQIFFELTKEGLQYLASSKLSATKFLKLLSDVYNNNQNLQTLTNIDEIFTEYEKTNRPFPDEFIPLLSRNLLPQYPSIPDAYVEHKAVLNSIAHEGPLTEIQLSKRFELKKNNGNILEDMLNSMMLTHFDSKGNKLCLSHIGILLLLDQITSTKWANFDFVTDNLIGQASEFFNKLRIDYRDSLPQIFRDWDKLSAISGDRIIIESIASFIHEPAIDIIHNTNDNHKRILNILELMANFQIEYVRNLVTACADKLCQILNSPEDKSSVRKISLWIAAGKKAEPPRMRKEIFQRLDLISKCIETIEKQSNFLPLVEGKKLLDRVGLSTNWKVRTSVLEPNIASQITFLFFTMFRQKLEEKSFLDLPDISLSFGVSAETSRNINLDKEKSRQDKINRYNQFLAEKKISSQYNKWIDQIIDFESKNIEELKALKIKQ